MASSRPVGLNENILTGGPDGISYDYDLSADELLNWEGDTDYDLVLSTTSEVLEMTKDVSAYPMTVAVPINGAISSLDYRRIMRPASGNFHGGIPGAGVMFTSSVAGSFGRPIDISEQAMSIQDFEITTTNGGTVTGDVINISQLTIGASAVGVIINDPQNSNAGQVRGFSLGNTGTANLFTYIINCLIMDVTDNTGIGIRYRFGASSSGTTGNIIYNSTVVGCNIGVLMATGGDHVNLINVLLDGNADHLSGSNMNLTTCYQGTETQGVYALTYVDSGNEDFHIVAGDRTTMGAGTDLSASATYPFDDDIDFDIRSDWDIGFDELVAAAGLPPRPNMDGGFQELRGGMI